MKFYGIKYKCFVFSIFYFINRNNKFVSLVVCYVYTIYFRISQLSAFYKIVHSVSTVLLFKTPSVLEKRVSLDIFIS